MRGGSYIVVFDFPDLEIGWSSLLIVGDFLADFWHPAGSELLSAALGDFEVFDQALFEVLEVVLDGWLGEFLGSCQCREKGTDYCET